MSIKTSGFPDAQKRVQELVVIAEQKFVPQLATKIRDAVLAGADAHTKTGAMAQSVTMRRIGESFEIFHDLQRARYAEYVQWGTRPHTIKPKKRLALMWVKGNQQIFAKWVKHPGYKGDPYMARAADQAPKFLDEILREI